MATPAKNPDITVRGGLMNVPSSEIPTKPPRHQPNTPTNKKKVKPRSDHQIPNAPTAAPSQPPAEKPEEDKPDVPAKTQ